MHVLTSCARFPRLHPPGGGLDICSCRLGASLQVVGISAPIGSGCVNKTRRFMDLCNGRCKQRQPSGLQDGRLDLPEENERVAFFLSPSSPLTSSQCCTLVFLHFSFFSLMYLYLYFWLGVAEYTMRGRGPLVVRVGLQHCCCCCYSSV